MQGEHVSPADLGPEGGRASPRPPGVLVVDDQPLVLAALARGLEHAGFRVFRATGGEEALREYRLHRAEIDAVVSDVNMPGMTGPGLLAALKAEDPAAKVVLVTGDDLGGPEQLLGLGADRVLTKPLRPHDLAAAVREVIGRRP